MTDLELLKQTYVMLADAQEVLLRKNLDKEEIAAAAKLITFCQILQFDSKLLQTFIKRDK